MPLYTDVFYRLRALRSATDGRNRRIPQLDGTRGLLALGVFLHHAAIYRQYLRGNGWSIADGVLARLGPASVTLFFMITAFLFYGRLIDEQGRPSWRQLYIGRLFRIGPVYLLAIGCMAAIVANASEFQLRVSLGQLAGEIASWLALGAGPRPDLNGYPDTRHLLAGVTWTLQSEWLFYASLPLLALAVLRGRLIALLFPLAGLALSLTALASLGPDLVPACLVPFFAGMVAAALYKGSLLPALPGWLSSVLVVMILATIQRSSLDVRQPSALLLLGVVFHLIVGGSTLFGLLTSRVACQLGELSYGIYMLHGLVLSRIGAVDTMHRMVVAGPKTQLSLLMLATVAVLLFAELAHRLVEGPGVWLGRRIACMTVDTTTGPEPLQPQLQVSR